MNSVGIQQTNKSIKANNINLSNKKDTTITGSNLIANNDININTNNLNINASQDSYNYNDKIKELSGSIDYTIYGGGGGTLGLNYSQSHSDQENLINNNSQIYANNDININTTNDTTIKGANLRADNALNLNTTNLTLESLRDKYQANSKSSSIGVGISFSGSTNSNHFANGNLKTSSANANYGTSSSNSIIKQTNLSSITANEVNINAKGNTRLKGSMIAAGDYDENGKFSDNGNLNLSTNSLTFENLANTSYNKGSNFNIGVNYSFGNSQNQNNSNSQAQNSKNPNTDPNSKITSANYLNSRSQGYSSSKTLATIGQGNLIISNLDDSDDLDRLNRNTDEINKDLYSTSISSNIEASIDTRLFTTDGREKIKQDFQTGSTIIDAITQIATTDRANITDFFKENGKAYNTLQGVRDEIANNPELREALNNPNLSEAQKSALIQEVTNSVMANLGYLPNETKAIYTDEKGQGNQDIKGFYSLENGSSYINLKNNDTLKDLVATTGTESQRAMDNSDGIDITTNRDDNSKYALNFGEFLSKYYGYALGDTTTYANAKINNPANVNLNYYTNNNNEFGNLDKEKGANRINLFDPNEVSKQTNTKTVNFLAHLNVEIVGPAREFFSGYKELYVGGHGNGNEIGTQYSYGVTPSQLYEKHIVNDETWKKGKVESIYLGACNSASYAQELANIIYEKTGKNITVYGSNGTYYYWVPLLNSSAGGMEPFKPNIVKNKK